MARTVYLVQVVVLKSIVHEERGIDVIDEQEEIADYDLQESENEADALAVAHDLVERYKWSRR